MKRIALFFVIILFSTCLTFAQNGKGGVMSKEDYLQGITEIWNTINNIVNSKVMIGDKEEFFVPKSNPQGNAALLGMYKAQIDTLEGLKNKLQAMNSPVEYAKSYELYGQAIDCLIESKQKSVESLEKDDITIMNNGLFRKGIGLLLQAADLAKKGSQ